MAEKHQCPMGTLSDLCQAVATTSHTILVVTSHNLLRMSPSSSATEEADLVQPHPVASGSNHSRVEGKGREERVTRT